MRLRLVLVLTAVLSACIAAVPAAVAGAQSTSDREFKDGKLVSASDPAVSLEADRAFHYVGGQVIDIFKVAGADQHFFVDAAPDGTIRRFYWIQFEHYYPTNRSVYDYSSIKQAPVQLGALEFMGDAKMSADYFTSGNRSGSDSEAGERFLRAKGYKVEGTFVRVRLFYLPDASRRRELMIIYGEAAPAGAFEDAVKAAVVRHAQKNLKVVVAPR